MAVLPTHCSEAAGGSRRRSKLVYFVAPLREMQRMQKISPTSGLAVSGPEAGAKLNARQRARRSQDEICAAVREWVASGSMGPGDPLPPERTLAERFAATRKTVREALDRLAHEALI